MKRSITILAVGLALAAGYSLGRWHARSRPPAPAPAMHPHAPPTSAGAEMPGVRSIVEQAAERALPLPTLEAGTPAPTPTPAP